MLPVIQHNHEAFKRNFAFCGQCPDLDVRTGLCKGGVYHAVHCNADYCPAGKFGKGKPANWPHAEEARLNICRACKMHQGHTCTKDAAGIRDHAREAVCPVGRYVDGITGTLTAPSAAIVMPQPQSQGEKRSGCCGG